AGFVLFLVPLRGVHLGGMTGLGLISVLPLASLAGLALQVLAFVALLARRRPPRILLSGLLILITFCLAGVTGLIEPLPRFAPPLPALRVRPYPPAPRPRPARPARLLLLPRLPRPDRIPRQSRWPYLPGARPDLVAGPDRPRDPAAVPAADQGHPPELASPLV